MSWEATLGRLGDTTADGLLALLQQHRAGLLTVEQLTAGAVDLLQLAGLQGTVYGETAFQAFMTVSTGTLPRSVGAAATLQAGPYRHKLQHAVSLVLTEPDPDALADRLARLGQSDPLQAAQRAYADAMARDDRVTGWVRGVESDGCQLCVWWSRDGQEWPARHPMPTHPGCKCVQVPISGDVQETGYTRSLKRREAAERNRDERAAAVRAAAARAVRAGARAA